MSEDLQCSTCRIRALREHESPVVPDYRDGEILIVSDFPVIEDIESGLAMSGMHKRTTMVSRLLHESKIDPDKTSYATVLRCITKSKAIITLKDYEHCGQILLEEIRNMSFKAILCLGSVAGTIVTGNKIASIERIRGTAMNSVIPGAFCMVTYSLGVLVDTVGCGGCGGTVHPTLAIKDTRAFYKEYIGRKDAEHKTK